MKKSRNILIEIITSKSFIGSFIFAIALWIYTSLNAEYSTFIKIPLSINLPENRAIASDIPANIQVELKGTGWHLLNLFYINTNISCKINLNNENIQDSVKLTRKDFQKGIINNPNLSIIDFSPEQISLKTGKVYEVAVPIKSNLKVNPYDGYLVVGDIILHPNMVVLKGDYEKVINFSSWFTERKIINGLTDTYETTVNLSDTLKNIIQLSENQVSAQINIQQLAEHIIYDVPIKIKGGILNTKHKLEPQFLTLVVRGGINQLYDFNPESVSAEVDISNITNDSLGVIFPEIKVPRNINIINTIPKFLTHKIIDNISKK